MMFAKYQMRLWYTNITHLFINYVLISLSAFMILSGSDGSQRNICDHRYNNIIVYNENK